MADSLNGKEREIYGFLYVAELRRRSKRYIEDINEDEDMVVCQLRKVGIISWKDE
jgi:hypothetical protein